MRADHRLSKDKTQCRRCGLTAFHSAYCPPGFWMTATESREWNAAGLKERTALEQQFLSRVKK